MLIWCCNFTSLPVKVTPNEIVNFFLGRSMLCLQHFRYSIGIAIHPIWSHQVWKSTAGNKRSYDQLLGFMFEMRQLIVMIMPWINLIRLPLRIHRESQRRGTLWIFNSTLTRTHEKLFDKTQPSSFGNKKVPFLSMRKNIYHSICAEPWNGIFLTSQVQQWDFQLLDWRIFTGFFPKIEIFSKKLFKKSKFSRDFRQKIEIFSRIWSKNRNFLENFVKKSKFSRKNWSKNRNFLENFVKKSKFSRKNCSKNRNFLEKLVQKSKFSREFRQKIEIFSTISSKNRNFLEKIVQKIEIFPRFSSKNRNFLENLVKKSKFSREFRQKIKIFSKKLLKKSKFSRKIGPKIEIF